MKVEVTKDPIKQKVIVEIDHRDLMSQKFAGEIVNRTIQVIADSVAQEYLEKNRSKLLSGLDAEVIKDIVNIEVARRAARDHAELMGRIDPLARSIPDLNKQHNEKMKAILQS